MAPSTPTSQQITWRGLMAARLVLLGIAALAFGWLAWVDAARIASLGWLPKDPRTEAGLLTVVAWVGVSVGEFAWTRRTAASAPLNGMHLLVDVACITSLLACTGAAQNPFTVVYFVPLTLATQVSQRWTWIVAAAATAAFASMFMVPGSTMQGPHAHHFAGHMRGMWYAFAVSGGLLVIFVQRIAAALESQRAELIRLRERGMEDRHLGAIGALAAGAAHELGTPLGTISMLSEELPHLEGSEREEALRSIRVQLQRAKSILGRMRTPELSVESFGRQRPWALRELEAATEGATESSTEISWRYEGDADAAQLTLPLVVVGQILRELLRNAERATLRTEAARPIVVEASVDATQLELRVCDEGPGMDQAHLESAFLPLATTRPEGMGLGLYLARAHARSLDGSLEIDSAPGEGTRAHLRLPITTPANRRRAATPEPS